METVCAIMEKHVLRALKTVMNVHGDLDTVGMEFVVHLNRV